MRTLTGKVILIIFSVLIGSTAMTAATKISAVKNAATESNTVPTVEQTKEPTPAEVLYCHDGDTCRVRVGGLWINVRLAGIDAPEVKSRLFKSKEAQPMGEESKEFLNGLIRGKQVMLKQSDLDRYNRPVVEIFQGDSSLNIKMVELGYAEAYRGKAKRLDRDKFIDAEKKAQTAKLGIWNIKDYQSPGDFRKVNKK